MCVDGISGVWLPCGLTTLRFLCGNLVTGGGREEREKERERERERCREMYSRQSE